MALVKYNDNSISAITAAAGLANGAMTHIKTVTASDGDATVSFVHGTSDVVLDSTYPIYVIKIMNAHAETNNTDFTFNFTIDGSNWNVTKTTTAFQAYHNEDDGGAALSTVPADDLAQGTGFQQLTLGNVMGNENDECYSGEMYLFDPSSTTYAKHFMSRGVSMHHVSIANDNFAAGYANTTSAVTGVQFKMVSGDTDAGSFKLYGIKDS
jgi:hypothetical protein